MRKKLTITFTLFLLLALKFYSQDFDKWQVGINTSAVIFGDKAANKVKDGINSQFPSFEISLNVIDKFSLELIYTFEGIETVKDMNEFKYSSLDGYLRYDFPEIFSRIEPFVGIGAGYITGATTVIDPKDALSLNFVAGGTLWLSDKIGLRGRFIYKHLDHRYTSMAPHLQALAGVVYQFNVRSGLGRGRKRIWEMEH